MKKDICTDKKCPNYGRYCRLHPGGELKKPKPVAPRSKKLDKIMRKEYVPQVKEMVEKNTPCKVHSPVCTGKAQGFHHLVGRIGKNLTADKKIPSCNNCNSYIEQNDLWARSNGFKLSKFAPENNNRKAI